MKILNQLFEEGVKVVWVGVNLVRGVLMDRGLLTVIDHPSQSQKKWKFISAQKEKKLFFPSLPALLSIFPFSLFIPLYISSVFCRCYIIITRLIVTLDYSYLPPENILSDRIPHPQFFLPSPLSSSSETHLPRSGPISLTHLLTHHPYAPPHVVLHWSLRVASETTFYHFLQILFAPTQFANASPTSTWWQTFKITLG